MTQLTHDEIGQLIQLVRTRKTQKIRSNELTPLLDSIERKLIKLMDENCLRLFDEEIAAVDKMLSD